MSRIAVLKVGTTASGFYGHEGRPGHVGGSTSYTTGPQRVSPEARARYAAAERERWAALNQKLDEWLARGDTDLTALERGRARREMQRILKEGTGGKFKGHPAEFISKSWETVDEASGMKSVVNRVTVEYNRIYINGMVRENKEGGTSTGTFSRSINSDGEVHNGYFSMDQGYEGNGFGSAFYRNSELRLKQYGMKRITIFANISVGGYAWARMGYDFEGDYTRRQFISDFKDYWIQSSLSLGNTAEQAVQSLPKLEHSWDIAAADNGQRYSITRQGRIDNVRIGKFWLLGGDHAGSDTSRSWDAVKYLDDSADTWKVGQVYFDVKVKKGKGKK